MNRKTSWIAIVMFILAFALGAAADRYLRDETPVPKLAKIQETSADYKFTAPLLAMDITNIGSFPEYNDLESNIRNLLENERNRNGITGSVYLRNLSDGSWMGIDENDTYHPGSLFKVPIMIAYLKQAESDPAILDRRMDFDERQLKSEPQDIPPRRQIEFGKSYSIGELINYMIIYSDNNAANLLASGILLDKKNSYTEMMNDLGLSAFADEISAKSYSIFLRMLYNATYLGGDMSERALETMSQSDYQDGLAAGLPAGTRIAHKFGEYGSYVNGAFVQELHECGIVYDRSPYLLCVMTRGHDKKIQADLIRDISGRVYKEVHK